MRILFNIDHPAKLHLFKHAIRILNKDGHETLLTVIEKDVITSLLEHDPILKELEHMSLGKYPPNKFKKAIKATDIEIKLLKIVQKFKPDILVGGCGNFYIAHVGSILKIPSLVFDTNDSATIQHVLTVPFATRIYTPLSYKKNFGKKHIRYNGFHELAYLHPKYFKPDKKVLFEYGFSKDDTLVILRLVGWSAIHDIGESGLSDKLLLRYIKTMEDYGATVLITSERQLSQGFEKYRIPVPPHRLHDLLYYSTLYIGEGATTASEAAMLGTHAIYINSIKLGYLEELERIYKLVYNLPNEKIALKRAIYLLNNSNLKKLGKIKRKQIIKDKIDVTEFMLKEIMSNFEGG
ncbi:MAG: DUF354 domain-containing protein, partial [Actinobacteria bacterium]|nr:DUF354 domain-containing protein [Actinomycetota bacterium]